MRKVMIAVFASALAAAHGAQAGDVRMLNGFNDEAERARFGFGGKVKVELAAEHATEGTKSAKVTFLAKQRWAGFSLKGEILSRWGDYDYVSFDVYNPHDKELSIFVRIDDDKSRNNDYSSQFGKRFKVFPGANTVKIKTARMPNQVQPWLQRKLDPNRLKLFCVWYGGVPEADTELYFDNFALRNNPRVDLPAGMRAFDFGPADADCWPGFTHVTPKSAYFKETGYGFTDTNGLRGLDDSFGEGLKHGEAMVGTSIYRSGGPLGFAVMLEPGRYKTWCAAGMSIYPKRAYTVSFNGRRIFECRAGDRLGDLDIFGRDYTNRTTIWETLFRGQICDEFTAEVDVRAPRAEITIAGDHSSWLSGGLRALVIYPAGDPECRKAFDEIQKQRRGQFLAKWRELKPAKVPAPPPPTAAERSRGFMLAYRHYAERISPHFVPAAGDRLEKLSIAAAPGEREPAVFIVYPTRDAAKAEVKVSDLRGRAGTIPSDAVTVEYVHYRYLKASGGMEAVASHVVPRNWLALEKGVPRQLWMTVRVPDDAKAGTYSGSVTVAAPGGRATFPLEVEVYPFRLPSVADCGLIYAHIYSVPQAREDVEAGVRCLAEHNVNSATVSGVIKLKGKDPATGRPTFDFSRLDMVMDVMKKAGMTGPVPLFDMSIQGEGGGNSYPHLGFKRAPYNYKITDQGYYDAMTELTRRVKERAEEKNYLPVLMYPVTELSNDPYMGPPYLEKLVKAFRKVDGVKLICSLNTPKDIVCAKYLDHMMVNWGLKLTEERLAQIRNDGAKLWFQNIGQSRYTEGFLMLKAGAIGRRQWIVSGNAGGRVAGGDPYNGFMGGGNSSVLFCAPGKAIPNVTLKWMSEGADDYRYATKLLRLIREANEKGPARAKAAAADARKAYDGILGSIRINTGGARIEIDGRCDRIGDFKDKSTYDRFRREIAAHITKLSRALGR